MRRLPGCALLGVLCLGGPALGQGYYDYDAQVGGFAQDPEALVRYWYARYFSRPADPIGMVGWAQMLRQGWAPANVLSAMLSSQEYFGRAGFTPQGFARTLFLDVTGREPTPREFGWMMGQLAFDAGPWPRAILAYNVLQRYPQGLYPPFAAGPAAAAFPPGRPWRAREWHEFEYRRPGWRFGP
jgi:hypothetical protein